MSFFSNAQDTNCMDMTSSSSAFSDDLSYAAMPRYLRRQQKQQQQQTMQQYSNCSEFSSPSKMSGNRCSSTAASPAPQMLFSHQPVQQPLSFTSATNMCAQFGVAISAAASSMSMSCSQAAGQRSPNTHDRFIVRKSQESMDIARHKLISGPENRTSYGTDHSMMDMSDENSSTTALEQAMFGSNPVSGCKILAPTQKAPEPPKGYNTNASLRAIFSQNRIGGGPGQAQALSRAQMRHIPTTCEKVLDAPGLVDDYYLNLLDWSSQNIIAIALSDVVYLWNAETGAINQLMQTEGQDNFVTSISWLSDGQYLALGTNYNDVQIWDVEKSKRVRCMDGHRGRVTSLSWNGPVLSSGGRDGLIIHHDVRKQQHVVSTLMGHDQEVCGLKWSPDGSLLASGGNDNVLNIWSLNQSQAVYRFTEHTAAVKAIAWCPWQQNLLASGGGTADRKMCFWNTSGQGSLVNSIDTRSQVCSIVWSKNDRELVSSHGFSQNQLTVWKYPSLVKMAELTGHTSRVLHMAQSPDGSTVVSAAGDETLRFWKIFSTPSEAASKAKAANASGALSMRQMNIR